jgi:hypothetical protein
VPDLCLKESTFMRLTVRTLLAWMDGVLGPDDQRELAAKVEASPVAQKLAERARIAADKPGLSAPQVDGRGLADEPNTAAEFLDNVLEGTRLEAFERVCVESDMVLGEVAACHAILTELNRNPNVVEPPDAAARRRLLDAVSKHVATGGDGSEGPRNESVSRIEITDGRAPPTRRGRPPAVAAWAAAITALSLLIALAGVLMWSLSRGSRRPHAVAAGVSPPARPVAPPAADQASIDQGASPAEPREPPVVPADSSPMKKPEDPAPAAVVPHAPDRAPAPGPPPEAPAQRDAATVDAPAATVEPPARPPEARRVPHGDALAIVAPPPAGAPMPAMPDTGAPAATPAPPLPPAESKPAPGVVGPAGFLLRRLAADGGGRWAPLVEGAALGPTEDLVVPPWCHPLLTIDGVSIRLEPNTRATIGRDIDGTPRLEIVFGRAVVWSEAADARLGITAGGLVGVLTGELRAPAGVELSLHRPPGTHQDATVVRRLAQFSAGSTQKVWRQTAPDGSPASPPLSGIEPEVVVAARAAIMWDDADPAAARLGPPSDSPAWLRGVASEDRIQREAARALARRLAGADEVVEGLHAMAADRRAENRLIAAATLALLGEYGDLVALLFAESPGEALTEGQWTTLEAMTVPLALARGDNAAKAFAAALEARAPAGRAPVILDLARGFSEADLAAGGDATLVESIADEHLVVRRYASRRLAEIVQPEGRQRAAYRADHPPKLRDEAMTWWRARLEQGQIRRRGDAAESPATAP